MTNLTNFTKFRSFQILSERLSRCSEQILSSITWNLGLPTWECMYKMIVCFFAKVITLFDLFGVHRLHAELEKFVCTVENTPKATLTLMWIVVIQRKNVSGDWTRLKIANMLIEPHVDLNLQCQMHPSYLSNPSDLLPCLEQKLVAQLHTQCAPEICLCFCGNHGAMLLFWNMLGPNQSCYRKSKEILDGC